MADDQMLKQSFQLIGKSGNRRELGLQHLQLNDHVAEQLPATAIGKRPSVGKLMDFADIVEEGAGQQQVAIDLRIVSANQIAGAKQ